MLYVGNSDTFKKSVNKRWCRIRNLKVSHQRRNVTGSEVMEMQGRGF